MDMINKDIQRLICYTKQLWKKIPLLKIIEDETENFESSHLSAFRSC